jgi:hypothetical protein
MVTQERLLLGNIASITRAPRREWRESRYDFYLDFLSAIRMVTWTAIDIPSPRSKTQIETIFDELDSLRNRTDNIPGYVFKPTKHAIRSAKSYIFYTYVKMMGTFPWPSFVLDGEAGIIIKWTRNRRTVRLNCMAEPGDQDYIYFENGEYDVEDNVTPNLLRDRLNWLIGQERAR